jgi:glycosyltransferase involved in cell wall biosynthesis
VQRCKLLVTVSESTKADLVSAYGVKEHRIRVVPLGASPPTTSPAPASRLSELGLNGNFVLQVGRIEGRKNQAAALAAVERLDGVTLVVAGPERDTALAAKLRESSKCKVLGRVDQATLELLYKQANAVVVPSLYEGFGLPVLEAMARGKVVVAAKSSSLPEVGGEAALYVHDASDPEQLAKVLEVALGDKKLRTSLGRAARERARKYTWEKTAAGVAAVIRELVEAKS